MLRFLAVSSLPPAALIAFASAAVALGQTGLQVNTDGNGENTIGDAANEPSLAVSPLDPNVMVIGWREFPDVEYDKRYAGYAYTRDGGRTWTNGGTLDPPPNKSPQSQQTDPVLAVDSAGVFYYWSEVFRPDPPTSQHVYRSPDGGASWGVPAQVQDPATSGDKEWMAIDRTGGMGDGHVYGGWSRFAGGGYHVFVRSIDGGRSFSEPMRIADRAGRQFMLHFAVGPDGELYAAWRHYSSNSIYVTKSVKARDPNIEPTFDALGAGGVNGLDVRIDNGNDPGFLWINPVGFHQVWLGVDPAEGQRRGHVYCMWADRRNDAADVMFARSVDGGATWQTGIRVNDDPINNGAVQWMVAMDVAPHGRIDAVWYDTRDDARNRLSALYHSRSYDGGQTWSRNRRFSQAFDSRLGFPAQNKIGDYTQIVSLAHSVNIAYAATFNGEQDVWFLRIPVFDQGDVNCDGSIDLSDVEPFLTALRDPAEYEQRYPDCDVNNADVDDDGSLNMGDVAPFVELLLGRG